LRLRADDTEDLILRLSGDEMGTILDISPETVRRVLSDFCHHGIITKERGSVATQRYLRGNITALENFAQEI